MNIKNGDLPAMPITTDENICRMTGTTKPEFSGLTKREQFAAQFMAAWIIHHGAANNYGYSRETAVNDSIADADALLEALERTK